MKPLYLELQAFGPYVEKQTVDFEKLSEKGMFLIMGKTGSGKTTIFDAMTFALYGGSSGENEKSKSGRNDLEEWRCSQAESDVETFVRFTFSSHGRKYIFARSLVPKRKNLSAQLEAGEIDEDGNVIPFFENPKKDDLKAKAEELIGLTKEQFRQVVLLPQGQFERFLTATSDEKEVILQKIFGTYEWKKYADKFYEAADKRKKELNNEKEYVDAMLSEEGADSLEAVDGIIEELKAEKEKRDNAHIGFDGERRRKKLDEDIKLAEAFKPLHELERRAKELAGKEEEIKAKKEKYGEAEKAEELREFINAFRSAYKAFGDRKKAAQDILLRLPVAEVAVKKAQEALSAHKEQSPVEECQKKIGEYESKKSAYESFDELSKDFSKADKSFKDKKRAYDSAREKLDLAQSKSKSAANAFNAADDNSKTIRGKYNEGIYGEIAGNLSDNTPCPVCGSLCHPNPAGKTPDSVSKADVDRAEAEREAAKKSWDSCERVREEAAQKEKEAKEALVNAEREKNIAQAQYEAVKEQLIEGVESAGALEIIIGKLKKTISDFEEKTKKLEDTLNKAKTDFEGIKAQKKTAQTETEKAEKDFNEAEKALGEKLREKGYEDYAEAEKMLMSPQQRSALHEEIIGYETECKKAKEDLDEKKKELEGKTEPEVSLFEERRKEIDDENKAYTEENTRISERIKHLLQKKSDLSEKWTHYKENIIQAESDLSFARKLRGDTGVGLQRYVLAVMFNQVIGEANRMLENVHGGRYHLFRTDDKGSGNKKGLELKVHDNRSPDKEGRPVSMLSGGEKFLVSLSLSIGISTIAQKSGVQIEALFIDEGFGTLDEGSVQDAINILESVRKSSAMIGIISHVQLLEATIPTHLEVVKKDEGSSIVLR